MIIRNHTPFDPIVFSSLGVEGSAFKVAVVRGTFRVHPHQPLRTDPRQAPLVKTDTFHGESAKSSLYLESDLAPFKPRTDVHIHAVAHAPGGWPEPSWIVRMQVGRMSKSLRVLGPRRWIRREGRYELTEPEACTQVPLRYELAFGGMFESSGEVSTFEENPVGVGYVPEGSHPVAPSIPAPQIESLDEPVRDIGVRYEPECFGPIFRGWSPRRERAGTFDEAWLSKRWPRLPPDFSFSFYNSAHPDLICPGYLAGNEEVVLEGVSAGGDIRFSLPGYRMVALARSRSGRVGGVGMALDTVVIDVAEMSAFLTWRAILPGEPLSVVELRAWTPEEVRHEQP